VRIDDIATDERLSRRELLRCAASFGAVALGSSRGVVQASKTRLILLGTGGGPRPRKGRMPSAQVILVNNTPYVVDCGNGVARQLVLAGVPLARVRHVFVTHHHSDHNADYGNLLLLAWAAGLRTRVDTWGPPPLERMTALFFEMSAYDINTRIADEGRVPLVPLVHAHELTKGGQFLEDENVKVTAALVDHRPIVPAFGYRFDARDRSIVISGDTAPSDELIRLAQGADVLVHEVLYLPAVDRLVAGVQNAPRLKDSIISHHTTAEDVGRIAKAAGVKTLVLSHFVPAEEPPVTDQMWLEAARVHFNGEIIVGKDLMEI
jgi:ribonuclease BN (tRNA processing enzyme)